MQNIQQDPNWPAYFFHPDGAQRCCKNEREREQLCPESEGWRGQPYPPPAKPLGPVPAHEVEAKVAEAVKGRVEAALAEQKAKHDEQKKKAQTEYRALDKAYGELQAKNDYLVRDLKELQAKYDALQKRLDLDASDKAAVAVENDLFAEAQKG